MNIGKLSLMPSRIAIRKPAGVQHQEREMRELSAKERHNERTQARSVKRAEVAA